jgi:hypothetical protein
MATGQQRLLPLLKKAVRKHHPLLLKTTKS